MHYLTEEYWGNFIKEIKTKDGKRKVVHDGIEFEKLIGELLKLLYQNQCVHWEKTKMTHDGSKDFLGKKSDGSYIWAECKNYRDKVSLKVIAPTLVMAEINDIQEILVFSYSAINYNTKKKLLYYANKREKKIYYYDDENLERLLFRFRTKLFPKFFRSYKGTPQTPLLVEPYVFSCSMPGIYYNNEEEFASSTFNIKLNELMFIGIGIANNNYIEKINVKLSFDNCNDLEYMEVVDSSVNAKEQYNWNKQIALNPGEAKFCKLYFKPVRFKKELSLPSVKLNYFTSKIPFKVVHFKNVTCDYLFRVPLIGSCYVQALQSINDNTINKSKMSLAYFYGKSGVGKSRMLQEALSIYVRNHYNVLNFTIDALAKDSLYMLREIIYFIYNLTPELVIESLKTYQAEDSLWGSDQLEIINLLQSAIDEDISDFLYKLARYKYLIFEKILAQKNVIIIDNIQFAEFFFVDFLYDLCVYAKSYQRNTKFVLVLSCNTDYYCSPPIKKLQLLITEISNQSYINIFVHEVAGMKRNDLALGYLKQLIQTEDERSDIYLEIIVKKADYVPKHIENIVEYLLNKKILDIENNYFIINNLKDFYDIVDSMPVSFSKIFRMRFQLFLTNENLSENSVVLVISAIHFLGYITKEHMINLCLELNILQQLLQYGFIELNNLRVFQFSHDLYEQFFIDNYALEEIFLNYIIESETTDKISFCFWQKILIRLKQKDNVSQILRYILESWCYLSDQIPYNLKKYFYSQVVSYLSLNRRYAKNFEEYMECSREICLDAKNKLGINYSKLLFESIYNEIEEMDICKREKSKGYQNFVYEYSENLLQGNISKAITIYKQRIRYLSQDYDGNYELIARLYNRIYVYYKNKKAEKEVHTYLKRSMDICVQKNLKGLFIENLYDEGNYYLYEPEKKERLIECWSQGFALFERNCDTLEYLTLNSLKKKIQVDLICNKYDDIEYYLEQAFDYVETGQFNQQTLFFNASLYCLKAIYGLLSKNINIDEIRHFIDMAGKYYILKNNEKPYTVHFLYAKLAFTNEKYQEMLGYYANALHELSKKHYHYKHIKKIILDDCSYKIGLLKMRCTNYSINYHSLSEELIQEIHKLENLSDKELVNYLDSFQSISNLTSQNKKEGFVY